jgi:hypothetical protein
LTSSDIYLPAMRISEVLYSSCRKISRRDRFRAMAKKAEEEKTLTVKRAAAQIGAAKISLRIWAKAGRFPGAKKEEMPMGN